MKNSSKQDPIIFVILFTIIQYENYKKDGSSFYFRIFLSITDSFEKFLSIAFQSITSFTDSKK